MKNKQFFIKINITVLIAEKCQIYFTLARVGVYYSKLIKRTASNVPVSQLQD